MSDETNIGADADEELVARCRGGDVEAFEGLVRRHEKRMINVAYRITGNFDDACEVVQDAFVSAYRNLKKFRGGSRFSTWLCSIVLNLSRNRLRQSMTRAGREAVSIGNPSSAEAESPALEPASEGASPLAELELKEVREKVKRCLEALEAEFREAMVLRDVQGFSYAEIGGMLGLAEGTVKSRLHRARESVRECLKRALGGLG
ncbi:MAG: sigma-70 family RNA polymerase sigma factor [Nitrospirota bacterium]|jgi:RNA polymerase sigma-70 factor (ECF subfamily)